MAGRRCKISIAVLLTFLGLGQILLNIVTVVIQNSPVQNNFSAATNCTLTYNDNGTIRTKPFACPVGQAGGLTAVQILAAASAFSGLINLMSSLLLLGEYCCDRPMRCCFTSMRYVIISNSITETVDLAVTIIIALNTSSPSSSGLSMHLGLAVSAEVCSLIIGIIQPLVVHQKERKSLEYY